MRAQQNIRALHEETVICKHACAKDIRALHEETVCIVTSVMRPSMFLLVLRKLILHLSLTLKGGIPTLRSDTCRHAPKGQEEVPESQRIGRRGEGEEEEEEKEEEQMREEEREYKGKGKEDAEEAGGGKGEEWEGVGRRGGGTPRTDREAS
jgi:hypothetical protein